jgi:signal transduction histidine kinase/DNA-binding response OmpR family regulator
MHSPPPLSPFRGLQGRFLRFLAVACLATGAVSLLIFTALARSTVRDLGERFAVEHALRQKNVILGPIQREIALTQRMVDSPALLAWAANEADTVLLKRARTELQSFRLHFQDASFFCAISGSGHYYFDDGAPQYRNGEVVYTLNRDSPDHAWYYTTLEGEEPVALNVGRDQALGLTKLWINAVVSDGDRRLGVAGTGLTLNHFIQEAVGAEEAGLSTVLIGLTGTIQAHRDTSYIDVNTLGKAPEERSTIDRLLPSPEDREGIRQTMATLVQDPEQVVVKELQGSGGTRLVAVAFIPQIDWFVVTFLDTNTALTPAQFMPLAGLLVLSILAIVASLALLLNRIIIGPLRSVTASTKAIMAGDYSQSLESSREDEIGDLLRAYSHMIHTIGTRTDELESAREQLEVRVQERTAELEREVHERQEAQVALRSARDAAEMANAAKSSFLANMSHEIRTPMNAILGFTELLQDRRADQQQHRYLNAIASSGRTLLSLIDDILDLSKIEAGRLEVELEPVNPRTIFQELETVFSTPIRDQGIAFLVELDPTVPRWLLLDEVRFRQVLLNLAGNAVKFTSSGLVRLDARAERTEDGSSTVDLVVSVTDTGMGIAEAELASIFAPFQQQRAQSHARYGGTGLGLSISRRLVEMMGGQMEVQSRLGEGSIFTVNLRDVHVLEQDDALLQQAQAPVAAIDFEPATVLAADDLELNLVLVRGLLSRHNIRLLEAQNGREAVALAKIYQPDAILMDIRMPEMDGLEATRILKAHATCSTIPVIALTASAMADEEKAIRGQTDGFLCKPISRRALTQELARYLPHRAVEAGAEGGSESADRPATGGESESWAERVPRLLETLAAELSQEWESVRRSMDASRVEHFADLATTLGRDHQIALLSDWGMRLSLEAGSLNMERLPHTMDEFPGLVEKIRDSS